jgi:hypothetical protein
MSGPSVGQRGVSAQTIQLLVRCACSTKPYRCPSTASSTSLRRSTASSCHSGTCSSLNSGSSHSPYLFAPYCCFCNYCSGVRLKLAVATLPARRRIRPTAAAAAGSALRGGGRRGSLTHAAARGPLGGGAVRTPPCLSTTRAPYWYAWAGGRAGGRQLIVVYYLRQRLGAARCEALKAPWRGRGAALSSCSVLCAMCYVLCAISKFPALPTSRVEVRSAECSTPAVK